MNKLLSTLLTTLATTSLLNACSVTTYTVKTDSHSGFDAKGDKVLVEQLLKTTTSWDGSDLPQYPYAQPEITMVKVTIPVGAKIDLHRHLVINAAYVVSGQIKVTSKKGDTKAFKTGDAISELVETWHEGENIGNEPIQLIVFYAGAKDQPITQNKE